MQSRNRGRSIRTLVLVPIIGIALLGGSYPTPGGAPAGRVTGTVVLEENLATRRPQFRLYNDYGPGSVRDPSQPEERTAVVVYLEGLPPSRAPASLRVSLEQRNERFSPHVLAVKQGTVVEFPNRDPFFHNVFSLSRTKSFDLGRYAQGQAPSLVLNTPGVIQIYCQIHSDMSGYILVLENDFYEVVSEGGTFVFEDVPPGEYRLVAWHERITPVSQTVRVTSGSTSQVQIVIPLEGPA